MKKGINPLDPSVFRRRLPMDDSTLAGGGAVYLVPFRWWLKAKESVLQAVTDAPQGIPYAVAPAATSSTAIDSDLALELCRDGGDNSSRDAAEDEGVSSRCYALIRSDMWSMAIRWHYEASQKKENCGTSYISEDASDDVYPVMLRISAVQETSVVTVKICMKDNSNENFLRASKLFANDSKGVYIWDFSGQIDLVIMNEWNRMCLDGQRQSTSEILLEIQVYASSESVAFGHGSINDSPVVKKSKIVESSYGGGLLMSNGSIESMDFDVQSSGSITRFSSLGLTGLENLGNTCFMNSAIQCLAHTPKLVRYFLGHFSKEINHQNPLGLDGELALAFGQLLRKLWAPGQTSIAPHVFKAKLASFAPQFYGFSQHDCQELLAFLLDGLHEDLNRIKHKPYIEVRDASGRPDEEVADEYWTNHLARNDSIIVDISHGQYRSTLVCPVCNKLSVTFDPFIYLSLPLPSTTIRTMTITVFSTDGFTKPSSYTVNVPKSGNCNDLIQALSIACSLRQDETLLVAEVYFNLVIRFLEDPSDSLTLIRDGDQLAAYRLSKDLEERPLIVFMHQNMEEHHYNSTTDKPSKAFGVPLITRLPNVSTGSTVFDLFLKLINPFLIPKVSSLDAYQDTSNSAKEIAKIDIDSDIPELEGTDCVTKEGDYLDNGFQFYLTDENGQVISKIAMDESISLTGFPMKLYVLVCWHEKQMAQYDICLLNTLPEVYKFGLFAKRPHESVSLYSCLEAFLKEEPLGPEDMWYCPNCKKHQQACKKLDLWRLPDIIIVHLKRFSFSRFFNNKLEMFVDFPIHDLDLSRYLACKSKEPSKYRLYAVSNHYGNMGGGHYTAYIYHEVDGCWYDFDDGYVHPIAEDTVKSSAAYVLFYQRVRDSSSLDA
ncbi:ubiquitin carboxyl-terminal hydrolase 8-like isoform X1 [Canna indica]|uniref:Ubiquitin carboxyl-terminal hydrolase n=1 Tax=Canna indica TaxID=4628 RepID=A0AAQ3KMI4_9LILI|nr:ubiquitin carboxyl-terminal hydrolase 8-like isoform X1 [Canna indica]